MHSLYPHFICNCGFISFVGTLCFCAIYIHHSFRARIALWLKKNIWYLQLFLFTFIHYFMLQFVNTVCCVILCVILQYIHFLCILFWLFNEITCFYSERTTLGSTVHQYMIIMTLRISTSMFLSILWNF